MSLAEEPHYDQLPDAIRGIVGDSARLAVVHGLQLMDAPPDPDFDRLAQLAAGLFDAPLALLAVLDGECQKLKGTFGTDLRETSIEDSFCAHTLAAGEIMVVEDAATDPRFRGNPFVAGPPFIRFYAGATVFVAGQRVGTLAVIDFAPRKVPESAKAEQLRALAGLAGSLFTLKDSSRSGQIARAALAREEKRRGVALEAAGLASWVWNVDSDIVDCDPLLPELFGMPPTTRLRARKLFTAIDRRDVAVSRARFREAIETDGEYSGEYRVAGFEPVRWLAAKGRVVARDEDGRATTLFGVNFDISERKAAEERQRLLLRELNHRVKNTLATVQALATQTVRHAREPRTFLDAFGARLRALGAAHGLLSDREWKGIGIRELVQLEVLPFDDGQPPRIAVAGEDMMLPPDEAMGLGLLLHELGSNALKHGALSRPDGRVAIEWRIELRRQRRFLALRWVETGGPPVEPPESHGFGTILIRRSLAKVLDSDVDHRFLPGGVEATVTMPLAAPTDE